MTIADFQSAGVYRRVTQLSESTEELKFLQIVENIRFSDRSFFDLRVLQKRYLSISINKLFFQVDRIDGSTIKKVKTILFNKKKKIDYRKFLKLN